MLSTWRLCLAMGCLAVVLTAKEARANGRFPTAQHVVVGPGRASTTIALRTTFGILLSRDSGRTFTWLCEEAMYFPLVPSINYDAPIEIAASGSLVFGYEAGIRHAVDGCRSDDVPVAEMHAFADLTVDPTGSTVYAIENGEGVPDAVYRGDGTTFEFTRQGAGLYHVLFDTIEVAPSNTMRLYLSGRDTETFAPIFYRSDDGGLTLSPIVTDAGAVDSLWVSGVDPTSADTVYVRAAMGLGTELRRSRDGGRTFRTVASTTDPMLGFAMSDDGRTVWVGSIDAGLLRSDDGGDSFHPVNHFPVMCLRQHAGALWACSDWINQPFALGRSVDQGAHFEPVLRFQDFDHFIGPPAVCAARSEGAGICVERWPTLRRSLESSDTSDAGPSPGPDAGRRDAAVRDAPPEAEAGGVDATLDSAFDAGRDVGVAPPGPSGTCNCHVVGRATSRRWPFELALLGLAMSRRRRRRIA